MRYMFSMHHVFYASHVFFVTYFICVTCFPYVTCFLNVTCFHALHVFVWHILCTTCFPSVRLWRVVCPYVACVSMRRTFLCIAFSCALVRLTFPVAPSLTCHLPFWIICFCAPCVPAGHVVLCVVWFHASCVSLRHTFKCSLVSEHVSCISACRMFPYVVHFCASYIQG